MVGVLRYMVYCYKMALFVTLKYNWYKFEPKIIVPNHWPWVNLRRGQKGHNFSASPRASKTLGPGLATTIREKEPATTGNPIKKRQIPGRCRHPNRGAVFKQWENKWSETSCINFFIIINVWCLTNNTKLSGSISRYIRKMLFKSQARVICYIKDC